MVESIAAWQTEESASRLRARDPEAMRALYRETYPRLYRFGLSYCGNPDRAAEAAQQAFVEFLERPGQWDPLRGSPLVYLLGMTRNRLRERRRIKEVEPLVETTAADDVDMLEGYDRAQRVEAVRAAIASLPEHYREAILLCEIEELSYEDSARALEVPVGTIRSRLARGKAMLKEKLAAHPVRGGKP